MLAEKEEALSKYDDIIVFMHTGEKAPDGFPMCRIVGSFNDTDEVVRCIERASQYRVHGEAQFFAYTKKDVIEGLRTSMQERTADNN